MLQKSSSMTVKELADLNRELLVKRELWFEQLSHREGSRMVKSTNSTSTVLMTSKEIADLLGVCKSTARRLMLAGEIPAVKVGNRWYAPRAEVYKYLGLDAKYAKDVLIQRLERIS